MKRMTVWAVQASLRDLKILSVVGLLLALGGCAMPINVSYSPLAATESLGKEAAKTRAVVIHFSDERIKKDTIGVMKNTFGGDAKKLVTTDDVGLVLAEATTDALRKAGVDADMQSDRASIADVPLSEMAAGEVIVGGRIKTLEVASQPGWDTLKVTARIVVEIGIRRGGKTEWVGPIEGLSERREIQTMPASGLTITLDAAIQNCMRNMVRHLKSSGALQSAPTK